MLYVVLVLGSVRFFRKETLLETGGSALRKSIMLETFDPTYSTVGDNRTRILEKDG